MRKRFFMCLLFSVIGMSLFAADPFETPINNIIDFLRGPIAKGTAIIALIGAGVACIIQKGQGAKIALGAIAIGTIIIFGAEHLYKLVTG